MSEQNSPNTPTFEGEIRAKLSGDLQRNALDYIAYMNANRLLPATPGSNAFESVGEYVCQIHIYPVDDVPGWTIFMGGYDDVLCSSEYQDYPIDEELRAFAWAHMNACKNCGCGTEPGKRVMLFGKECKNLCSAIWWIRNPEGEDLELTKRLTKLWAQSRVDAAKTCKPYVPGEKEWPSAKGVGAHAGRPLGRVYTKSLDVTFYITPRQRYVGDAAFGFSGGGFVPAAPEQIPAALHIGGHSARFRAIKEPANGWAAVETLKYQANVTYFAEMSIDISAGTYSAMIWMLDANGDIDTPYCIAKDAPFRHGGESAVPMITAIDTVYMGSGGDDAEFIIRDFEVVGRE